MGNYVWKRSAVTNRRERQYLPEIWTAVLCTGRALLYVRTISSVPNKKPVALRRWRPADT